MAEGQVFELEFKARAEDRTQGNKECGQENEHRRMEFGEKYDPRRLRSFRVFARIKLLKSLGLLR